ncbi:hypothetical protein [Nodosilinea sp. E11]|uniref:hypothetical protein n=1 Tax=Nodosilinea sp. E11 TaxID=3037479 RepID=UPI0029344A62|nr:hypothetical protein [Nodosilinea sp. E11]WOD37835.1 hypothetical protein RRF56_16610 [Nodosilinea sp. E11]
MAAPVFTGDLVDMQPLDFLPQPIKFDFSEVLLEAALLEAALDAPSVPGHQAKPARLQPAPARLNY